MMNHAKVALFDQFFYPKSLAVIGVSADENAFGTLFLRSLLKFGFKGKVYPVNPRGGLLFGLTVSPTVEDISDSVDLAAVSVPGRFVSGVLEVCLRNYYLSHGVPVYPTVERAVKALKNVVKYKESFSQPA